MKPLIPCLLFFSCTAGGVRTSPYVEYERRIASNDGEGLLIGLSFSPEPEKPALSLPSAELYYPQGLPEAQEPEPEGITIETPWGPITVAGSVALLLFVAYAQKRGWLPSPKPKESNGPES